MRATVFRTDAKELFGGLKGRLIDQVYGALRWYFLGGDRDGRRAAWQAEPGRGESVRTDVVDPGEGGAGSRGLAVVRLQPRSLGNEGLRVLWRGAGRLATGLAPGDYQARPEIQRNVAALTAYLRGRQEKHAAAQRLFLLWASSKLHDLLPNATSRRFWRSGRKQEADGGWTLAALGPWNRSTTRRRPSVGSNSYATALAAFATGTGGGKDLGSSAVTSVGMAQDASGRRRILGGRIDEPQARGRQRAGEIHERCRDGLCDGGACWPRDPTCSQRELIQRVSRAPEPRQS